MRDAGWFGAVCFGVWLIAKLTYHVLTWHTRRTGRAAPLFLEQEEADRLKARAPVFIALGLLVFVLGLAMMAWTVSRVEDGGDRLRYAPNAFDERIPQQVWEALMYLSFVPIVGGGGMVTVGIRRLNTILSVRR